MKFEEFKNALRESWNDTPAIEPSSQWRSRLFRTLREEKPASLFDLFAESLPRFAMTAASCAVLIAGLTQNSHIKIGADSDDELAQFFNGDTIDQSIDTGISGTGSSSEFESADEVEVL